MEFRMLKDFLNSLRDVRSSKTLKFFGVVVVAIAPRSTLRRWLGYIGSLVWVTSHRSHLCLKRGRAPEYATGVVISNCD